MVISNESLNKILLAIGYEFHPYIYSQLPLLMCIVLIKKLVYKIVGILLANSSIHIILAIY